ncbi:MAG: hypothetical protein LBN11_06050 [Tannerella sp.]|jgi:hypothetical protein|nr:hypothetical protein [Tannerella sp.]
MTKKAYQKNRPSECKKAGFAYENQDSKTIGWNFRFMDDGGQWPCTFKALTKYRNNLLKYEGKTIAEILNQPHCHPINCDALSTPAKNRLGKLNFYDNIVQLDIGTPARLWGILHGNIFCLLWIDKKHEVYSAR